MIVVQLLAIIFPEEKQQNLTLTKGVNTEYSPVIWSIQATVTSPPTICDLSGFPDNPKPMYSLSLSLATNWVTMDFPAMAHLTYEDNRKAYSERPQKRNLQ